MNNHHQTEILLMLNTGFISADRLRKNDPETNKLLSEREKLKDECWNGLLPEILPECFWETGYRPGMLREVNDANTFLDLVFFEKPLRFDKEFSVNPYIFMEVLTKN